MQPEKFVPPMNLLLAGLPKKDYRHFLIRCEHVELVTADVLCLAGDQIHYVYFPITSIISLMKPVDTYRDLEAGMIGNEGILGSTLLLGVDTVPFRAVVQKTGSALRMKKQMFMSELELSFALQRKLKLYLYVLFSQQVQTAACNRFHMVEERLARLLLMIRDRAYSQSFHVTQESLALMLGVRRVGVTIAAGSLQHKNLISYNRGDLKIHDNAGLEAVSCSCYQTDKDTYTQILIS